VERIIEMAGERASRTTRAKATPAPPPLQKVLPAIPSDPEVLQVLERHLEVMGCAGLLSVAWGSKENVFVEELLGAADNRYDGTLRAHPELWGVKEWKETYGFRRGVVKVVERRDDLLAEEFIRAADPKEGFAVEDLRDPEARLVLGFLNPIFHPEKPKRIVAKWAATFLGAMRKSITVDWATLTAELVDRKVKDLRRVKKAGSPLSAYLLHLYVHFELLSGAEQDAYEDLLSIQKYGGPEPDSEEEESDAPTPASSPPNQRRKRSRSTQRTPELETAGPSRSGKEPEAGRPVPPPERAGRIPPVGPPELTGSLTEDFIQLTEHLGWRAALIHQRLGDFTSVMKEIGHELGTDDPEVMVARLRELRNQETRLQILEQQQATMAKTCASLRTQAQAAEKELGEALRLKTEAEERANASARALAEVKAALDFPVDTVNRSLLFTARLEKEGNLNRGQIIRFLQDHSRKMEKTWVLMQGLVAQLIPAGPEDRGTQAPQDLSTPVRVTTTPVEPMDPSGATPGSAEKPIDLGEIPEHVSPMSWSDLSPSSPGILSAWKGAMLASLSPPAPSLFRFPSPSPQAGEQPTRNLDQEMASPSPPRTAPTTSTPLTGAPRQPPEESPAGKSESKGKQPEEDSAGDELPPT